MRSTTRRAVERLVEIAVEREVDAVTVGGDVFDGDWPDANTGLWWNQQLDRLVSEGIEVYIVHGNHDAQSVITKRIPAPAGVEVFGSGAATTKVSENLPLAVHGRSYATKATVDDLAATYPVAVAGVVNVGLLHTSLDGREGHAPYAPCTQVALMSKGYALWALGHVHTREHHVDGPVHILFPGNTQGRSIKETGARGVSIITTDETAILDVEHIDTDVARWCRIAIDIADVDSPDALVELAVERISDERQRAGRPMAVRIELAGAGTVHRYLTEGHGMIRTALSARLNTNEPDVWLEKMTDATRDTRASGAAHSDAVEAVRSLITRALEDPALARELTELLPDLQSTVAGALPRLSEHGAPVSLLTDDYLRQQLPRAGDLLIAMLEGR